MSARMPTLSASSFLLTISLYTHHSKGILLAIVLDWKEGTRMILRIARLVARAVLFAALFITFAQVSSAQVPQASIDKMVSLLKANAYNYSATKSPTVWVIHFNGTHLKDIKLIVALGNDVDSDMVIFVTVTEKRRMPSTNEFRYKLLKFNHEYDQVKVGLDGDDDLSVRVDGSLRLADADYVKGIINQIKNSSDEIYGKIEGDLVP